ncbi:cyclic nucleotide-binding domain-containing protein [Ramlibacter sp. H39-3-26]|uniref:cyclic nucleotide-binding domain-containing protein n=1 Tax=Curvibacter soli TaxID=3031331 RepID=UPI0023DCB1A9|nr:cyclic nucleotide-binding domain-containing protein [Ramlibacter sp. H39-3-26]MDF1485839.1 cyclic nucleotide-binding domain-containing protein [Ramlibacter sp. H39-3-26]
MKGILRLLRARTGIRAEDDRNDSVLFTTAFAGQGVDASMLVPWEARAVEVGARRLPASRAGKLLHNLWAQDKYMALLDTDALGRLERYFEFAAVPANRDVIRQDEYGNFMVVLLSGTIAVDRVQPWGEHLRLAETRPGDILGEMSLLDSGIRFSACTTLNDCEIAVLNAEAMDDMMTKDTQLAASLIALLARKLSLRLRMVSARLSEIQK